MKISQGFGGEFYICGKVSRLEGYVTVEMFLLYVMLLVTLCAKPSVWFVLVQTQHFPGCSTFMVPPVEVDNFRSTCAKVSSTVTSIAITFPCPLITVDKVAWTERTF